MKSKLVFGGLLTVMLGGLGFSAMGGMSWVDGLGLRGTQRLIHSRMVGYWDARVANDSERMAEYVHPARPLLIQPGTLITESYEIGDVKIEGDRAFAITKISTRLKHAMFSSKSREVRLRDKWVRFNGKWYREPGPVTIGDAIKKLNGTWVPPGGETAPAPKAGTAGANAPAEPVDGGKGNEGGGAGI